MIRTLWKYLTWFEPHMTWLLGAFLIFDLIYRHHWTEQLATYPEASILLFGLLLILSGRDTIHYRKRLNRANREKERLEEQKEMWKTYARETDDD